LNPLQKIRPDCILGEFDYAHPVFDVAAIQAQTRMPLLQGQHHTFYCGAWMGYGFHEDGLKAGLNAAQQLIESMQLSTGAVN
jgi:predicted NAD/FAD-binding protein